MNHAKSKIRPGRTFPYKQLPAATSRLARAWRVLQRPGLLWEDAQELSDFDWPVRHCGGGSCGLLG